MKKLKFLIMPLSVSERRKKIGGMCYAVLFLGAVVWYSYHVLCYPFPAAVSLAFGIGTLLFRWNFHHLVLQNSPVQHIISFATIIFSLQPADYFNTVLNEVEIIVTGLASVIFYFGLAELLFAVLKKLMDGERHPELFWKCLLNCFALSFTLLIFLPSETYLSNRDQMLYSYMEFAPLFIGVAVLVALAGASLLCTFRAKWVRCFSCISTGLLLCVYAQYMFMNKGLPQIGVDSVDWDSMTLEGILNAVIWLVLFSIPFLIEYLIRRKKQPTAIPKCSLLFSGALGGIQLVTLVVLVVTAPPVPEGFGLKRLSTTEQFVISSKKNVITLILDAADQTYFEEAYEQNPERFDFLRDFTYYTNTAMPYDSTFLSIPAMLTATQSRPEVPVADWYKNICTDTPAQTFYNRLHDADYTVNAYGKFAYSTIYKPFEGVLDNLIELTPENTTLNKDMLYSSIRKMIGYRAFPLLFKRHYEPTDEFGNDAVKAKEEVIHQNNQFLSSLKLRTSESEKNYFTVQHLVGLHSFAEGTTEENLKYCLQIMEEYCTQLKELGVYDDAMIIVTADHGKHNEPSNMPIWYIKKPHDKGEHLSFCSSPITLTDFPATVLDGMGLSQSGDEEILGRSIFDIPEDEVRTRLVFQRHDFHDKNNPEEAGTGTYFGYYFTGTKEDLAVHEENDPADVILKTKNKW